MGIGRLLEIGRRNKVANKWKVILFFAAARCGVLLLVIQYLGIDLSNSNWTVLSMLLVWNLVPSAPALTFLYFIGRLKVLNYSVAFLALILPNILFWTVSLIVAVQPGKKSLLLLFVPAYELAFVIVAAAIYILISVASRLKKRRGPGLIRNLK